MTEMAQWLTRLVRVVNEDPRLVQRGRHVDALMLLDTGDSQHLLGGDVARRHAMLLQRQGHRRMARHLQSLGFPKGATIAIVSKNCAHFVWCGKIA